MSKLRRAPALMIGLAGVLALGTQACEQLIGLDKFHDALCAPGATRACYGGADGTEGVGICKAGKQTCSDDGLAWGKCAGEVVPTAIEDCGNNLDDDCSTKLDDNCDGQVNEASAGCACVSGDMKPCYSGTTGTEGVGLCQGGMQACNDDGLGYGACMGEVLPATEDCSNATDEDCDGFACSQTIWAEQFGNGTYQQANRVAVDKSTGEIYVGGIFYGAMQFGNDTLIDAGGGDAFLAKLDASGTPIWAQRFGTSTPAGESIIALDVDGNGNVAILSQGDLGGGTNVMKLTPAGTPIWSKACGTTSGAYADAVDIAADGMGDVIIVGEFSGTIICSGTSLPNTGGKDVLVARLSGVDGSPVWVHKYGNSGDEGARKVAVDDSGNIYVAGHYSENFSFGNPTNSVFSLGSTDVYVVRFTPAGVASLTRQLADAGYQEIWSLAVDKFGGIVLAGSNAGTITQPPGTLSLTPSVPSSGYAAKLDASGNGVWIKEMVQPLGLACDSGGNVFTVSTLSGSNTIETVPLTSVGGQDLVLAKLAAVDGSLLWHRQFGDASTQTGTSVAVGNLDEPVVVGNFKGVISFDSIMLAATGNNTDISSQSSCHSRSHRLTTSRRRSAWRSPL